MSLTMQDANHYRVMMAAARQTYLTQADHTKAKDSGRDDGQPCHRNENNILQHSNNDPRLDEESVEQKSTSFTSTSSPIMPKLTPNKPASVVAEKPNIANKQGCSILATTLNTDSINVSTTKCSKTTMLTNNPAAVADEDGSNQSKAPAFTSTQQQQPTNRTTKMFLYDKSNFDHFKQSSFDSQTNEKTAANNDLKDQIQPIEEISLKTTSDPNNTKGFAMQNQSSSSSLSSATSSVSSYTSISGTDANSSGMDDEQSQQQLQQQSSSLDSNGKPLNHRRQWYHLWLPSYKSRLNQFQKQFTDKISSREKLIDDFVCAIQRELLLQGRMYVSLNYVSFYSNILGYETIINISYHDIRSISKASTVRLFPNAIQIITNSGLKYFFTSFVSRERAFRLMTRLWQLARQEQPMPWPEIRKLIRESYTTNSLGVDLSDIDDADVEIDLSKKQKKKKPSKRKSISIEAKNYNSIHFNSSSEVNSNLEDGDEDTILVNKHDGHQEKNGSFKTHNHADVQTDCTCDNHQYYFHNEHHQCSLMEVFKQLMTNVRRKLTEKAPSQSNMVRFLFMLAFILFLVQVGIYQRFTAMNQLLLRTQQLLSQAIENQRQSKAFQQASSSSLVQDGSNTDLGIIANLVSKSSSSAADCYYMNSGKC